MTPNDGDEEGDRDASDGNAILARRAAFVAAALAVLSGVACERPPAHPIPTLVRAHAFDSAVAASAVDAGT